MPSSLASRIASPLAVSTPNSACAEGEGEDVLSPLPTSSSLSRAASAAIARSGGSALKKKSKRQQYGHKSTTSSGRRGSGGNGGNSNGRGRRTSQMKVVARIRPLSAEEVERGCTEAVVPILDDCADDIIGNGNGADAAGDEHNVDVGADENAPPSSSSSVFHTPKIGNRRTTAVSAGVADSDNSPMAQQQHQRQPASTSLLAGGNVGAAPTTPSSSAAVPKQFDYDAVFSPATSQKDVYDLSVGDAVSRNVFRGYNTTIIAYGQTSSGKTYTMNGPAPPTQAEQTIAEDEVMLSPTTRPFVSPRARGMSPKRRGQSPKRGPTGGGGARGGAGPRRQSSLARMVAANAGSSATALTLTESDGIIPRAIHDLFETQRTEQREARIHLSYLEIYNDTIRDLLGSDDGGDGGAAAAENLPLLDDGHGVSVRGLSSTEVRTAGEAKELMDLASLRRTTGVSKWVLAL